MAVLTAGPSSGLNLDQANFNLLLGQPGTITVQSATEISVQVLGDPNGAQQDLFGTFTFDGGGLLSGGTITRMETRNGGALAFRLEGLSVSVPTLVALTAGGDKPAVLNAFFGGADTMTGSGLNDVLVGLGGADTLDGGAGTDIARYAGPARNYGWTANANGSWTVIDYRIGSPDGTDTLRNIETLRFSDGELALSTTDTAQVLRSAYDHILRVAPTSATDQAFVTGLTAQVGTGTLTRAAAIVQIVQRADASTAVATLAYQFFTGGTPSGEGLDYLVSPAGGNANNLNSAYYQSFNLENRYINFAVNLGKLGAGATQFQSAYGNLSLLDATKAAYAKIFGAAATDAKAHALIDSRVDYFAYYGQDGANGIGTKAAMVGWLLAEAVKADVGTYATSNTAYFTDLADGAAYSIGLVGVYPGTPVAG